MPSNKDNIEVFKKIKPTDFRITPFEVNKQYSFDESNAESGGFSITQCIFPKQGLYRKDIPPVGNNSYNPILNSNGIDVHVSWYSLRHNYYQGSTDWDYNFNINSNIYTNRILHVSASSISIPQSKFGTEIKKGSVSVIDKSTYYDITLYDDSNGNLYDYDIPTESIISDDNLLFYYGFNDKFSNKNLTDIYRNKCIDGSKYNNHAIVNGTLNFSPGIYTHGDYVSRSGYMANFDSTSSIQIQNKNYLNIINSDVFSLSFWIDIPNSQEDLSSDKNYILSKRVSDRTPIYNTLENRHDIRFETKYNSVYPFDIFVYNSNSNNNGKIGFSRVGGTGISAITSSNILTGSQHHITIQKSGSNIELYVDGELDSTVKDYVNGTTFNTSDIHIGSLGNVGLYLSGSIDEFRMYNKTLSSTEVGYLYNNNYNTGSAYQTNNVGNVFYKSGIMVISDPRPKYKNMLLGDTNSNGFDIYYKATVKLYEHEMTCKVPMRDFNVSLNPTTLNDPNSNTGELKSFVIDDTFTPYITTIGFYNDNYELLAVGKFARPIKKRHDVDITIICRFDI